MEGDELNIEKGGGLRLKNIKDLRKSDSPDKENKNGKDTNGGTRLQSSQDSKVSGTYSLLTSLPVPVSAGKTQSTYSETNLSRETLKSIEKGENQADPRVTTSPTGSMDSGRTSRTGQPPVRRELSPVIAARRSGASSRSPLSMRADRKSSQHTGNISCKEANRRTHNTRSPSPKTRYHRNGSSGRSGSPKRTNTPSPSLDRRGRTHCRRIPSPKAQGSRRRSSARRSRSPQRTSRERRRYSRGASSERQGRTRDTRSPSPKAQHNRGTTTRSRSPKSTEREIGRSSGGASSDRQGRTHNTRSPSPQTQYQRRGRRGSSERSCSSKRPNTGNKRATRSPASERENRRSPSRNSFSPRRALDNRKRLSAGSCCSPKRANGMRRRRLTGSPPSKREKRTSTSTPTRDSLPKNSAKRISPPRSDRERERDRPNREQRGSCDKEKDSTRRRTPEERDATPRPGVSDAREDLIGTLRRASRGFGHPRDDGDDFRLFPPTISAEGSQTLLGFQSSTTSGSPTTTTSTREPTSNIGEIASTSTNKTDAQLLPPMATPHSKMETPSLERASFASDDIGRYCIDRKGEERIKTETHEATLDWKLSQEYIEDNKQDMAVSAFSTNTGAEESSGEVKKKISDQQERRAKIKNELAVLGKIPKDFVNFVNAYLDYKESRNEEPKSEEVDEALTQMQMLGDSFEELKATVQSSEEEDEDKTEEEWSVVFEEKYLFGFSREIMDTFPLVLAILKFDNSRTSKLETRVEKEKVMIGSVEENKEQRTDQQSDVLVNMESRSIRTPSDGDSSLAADDGNDLFSSAMGLVAESAQAHTTQTQHERHETLSRPAHQNGPGKGPSLSSQPLEGANCKSSISALKESANNPAKLPTQLGGGKEDNGEKEVGAAGETEDSRKEECGRTYGERGEEGGSGGEAERTEKVQRKGGGGRAENNKEAKHYALEDKDSRTEGQSAKSPLKENPQKIAKVDMKKSESGKEKNELKCERLEIEKEKGEKSKNSSNLSPTSTSITEKRHFIQLSIAEEVREPQEKCYVLPKEPQKRKSDGTFKKIIPSDKKNLQHVKPKRQKITFSEDALKDKLGCRELDPMYLEGRGICRFRDRIGPNGFLQGCTRDDCGFVHRLPKHIKFETRDTSKVSHAEYRKYNLQYMNALEDLNADCDECKRRLTTSPNKQNPSTAGGGEASPSKLKSFDLRKKIGRKEENIAELNKKKICKTGEENSDIVQLELSTEDRDFFADRTETKSLNSKVIRNESVGKASEGENIKVPQVREKIEGHRDQRKVEYLDGLSTEEQEYRTTTAVVEEEEEDQNSRNLQTDERVRLSVRQRIGRRAAWSCLESANMITSLPACEDVEERTRDSMCDPRDEMMEIMTNELTDFLLSQPDKELRMSDIHWFSKTSTYHPEDFGYDRWIDLLPTIEAVKVIGEGLKKVICLRSSSSRSLLDPTDQKEKMKQVMIEELRQFLFFKPGQEWKMNEIQRFSWSSTYTPEHFGLRWNELLPSLGVATTSGLGNEKVFRLTPEHNEIALCNFKRDVKKALLKEKGSMSLSYLNYLLFGGDSPVTNDQIYDRLKDCSPEISSRWEESQQIVILSHQ